MGGENVIYDVSSKMLYQSQAAIAQGTTAGLLSASQNTAAVL